MRTVRAPSKRVVGGHDLVVALESQQVVGQRVDELGLDRVFDDRVAVAGDGVDVRVERRGVEHAIEGYRRSGTVVACRSTRSATSSPRSTPTRSCIPTRR